MPSQGDRRDRDHRSFDETGSLSGSAGCNAYTATYTTDRGAIEIGKPAATRKACAEPDGIMEQEAAYLEALPTAVRYRVAGRLLELLSAEGRSSRPTRARRSRSGASVEAGLTLFSLTDSEAFIRSAPETAGRRLADGDDVKAATGRWNLLSMNSPAGSTSTSSSTSA